MAQIKGASNTISTFKNMGNCNYINCRSGKQKRKKCKEWNSFNQTAVTADVENLRNG